jgi:hypothetical protein
LDERLAGICRILRESSASELAGFDPANAALDQQLQVS